MIYFFDNELNMVKVATSKNVISAVHEHELNGLILGTVETDLSYTEAFINDVDYFGYYYKDNYYLHKIKRVEHEHENELVRITGRHIFFEDMLYGDYIRDVRPVNRDALYILNQTISANTRWQTVMTDTSKLHSETYYWVPPMEVLNDLTENVGIEYEPRILFDGQKINGFQLHVANRIGEDTPIRVPFGSRVLNLKYEVDYSEIVTALYGHGKGEEVGDGYGRRINFRDVDFSRNSVVSRPGSLFMENPNVTAQYGKDDGSPKFGRIIFEDIESASELANATYEAYLEQSRPKMLFEASVVDLGDVGMGDGVLIIRREYDVYFNARIHKMMVDLLDAENADVELGDYVHFKESKVQRKTRENNNQFRRVTSNRIQQLKEQFNDRFDGEVNQMREDFEQALIDAHAEIQAAEERMETLINTTRNDWTEDFEAEVAEIYRKADEDYNRIETEITGVIDSTRNEMEMEFDESVQSTRTYAEQQAQEKAAAVRTDLETVTSGHQSMLEDLESNVMNIDDFIGDKTVGLNELLYNERMLFEDRINSINTWHYNLLRETQSLDNEFWEGVNGTIETDSNGDSYYRSDVSNIVNRSLYSKEEFLFEAGETYTLTFQVQTYAHRSMDYVWIMGTDSTVYDGNYPLHTRADEQTADVIHWSGQYRTYYITFTMSHDVYGRIRIGGNYLNNDLGAREYRIKKPYLTQSDNKQWLHNPEDSLQNLEEVTRRVTQLEDGREEFITKTQYDFETGEIEGTMRSILETVDGRESIIQNHEDWINTNGASVIESAEGFQSKAWLSDIHNPNMLQYTDFTNRDHVDRWRLVSATAVGTSFGEYIVATTYNSSGSIAVRSRDIQLIAGETYTLSFVGAVTTSEVSSNAFNFLYIYYVGKDNQLLPTPKRKFIGTIGTGGVHEVAEYSVTFTARETDELASILIGTRNSATGQTVSIRVKEPKLEKGDRATPYYNAFSSLTQRADEMMLAVQGIGEQGYLNQSDIQIVPDYVQLGSQRIDGDNIGSLLRVSPSGIDAVAGAMRLSGDLYVDGDIETLAISAIEGEFAQLWADEFEAITIDVEDITGVTAAFEQMLVDSANIELLLSENVFADGVTALVGNFVDVNAGDIVTSGLSANVIESEHIAVGTALIDKLFATSARIDRLITKTHFVNEIKATSIEAVYADLRSVNSEIMDTNILKADWIQGGNALLDKVFANTAMFERMMAKSGFVRTLNTVTIDTDQITIRRSDGGALISQGMQRFGSPIITKPFMSGDVYFENQNYITGDRGAQTFEVAYAEHSGRWATFNFNISLRHNSKDASALVGVVVRRGTSPPGVHIAHEYREFMAYRDSGSRSYNVDVRLPVPTFDAISWTLEFYVIGDLGNYARIRSGRCWVNS